MADQPVIKNRSVLGELDVPLLRRFVEFGEEIEVKAEHAENLLAQYANWEAVNDAAKEILARVVAAEKARNEPATVPAPAEPVAPVPPVVVAPVTPPASTPATATPAPAAPAPDATKEASA